MFVFSRLSFQTSHRASNTNHTTNHCLQLPHFVTHYTVDSSMTCAHVLFGYTIADRFLDALSKCVIIRTNTSQNIVEVWHKFSTKPKNIWTLMNLVRREGPMQKRKGTASYQLNSPLSAGARSSARATRHPRIASRQQNQRPECYHQWKRIL